LIGSSSTNRDTGGGPRSGESVVSAPSEQRARISSWLRRMVSTARGMAVRSRYVPHGDSRIGFSFLNGWKSSFLEGQSLRIPRNVAMPPLRRAWPAQAGSWLRDVSVARAPLPWGLHPEAGKQRTPFRELCLQPLLDFYGMVRYPLGLVVLRLLLHANDMAPELEVFREHACAFIFELAYP
jgi:hypothetical protein